MDKIDSFLEQIKEDICILQDNFKDKDPRINNEAYAFNYWILSRIYSMDEELVGSNITEGNDKNIDCFVFYKNNKELYIIQNKYYATNDPIKRNDVSDFLVTPLTQLLDGKYKSKELQEAFNSIVDDEDAKIFLHFNAANNKKNIDSQKNIDSFNITAHPKIKAHINAKYHTISDIYDLYYGKNYKNNTKFTYNLKTFNKGTFAALKEEYGIGNGICEPYYIIAPITEIYKMYKEAGDYPLFEENIREYLGVGSKTSVNNGIIRTLQDPEERKNFLYYNNGITITCSEIKTDKMEKSKRILPLIQPQIVNGCQTVNSIVQVLDNYNEEEIENEFSSTYIMVKALVIPNLEDEVNNNFAKNVVRYTNRQNAVSDKAFATNHDKFYRFQDEFKKRGFVLLVKPSDKIKYKDFLKNNKDKLMNKAKKYADEVGYTNFKFADLSIDLEKLLQVYLALREDGHKAYVYKPEILKQSSEIYNKYSVNIDSDLSIDNMIKLYLFYKKAEFDQKQNGLEKTPIPYYVIGFLNYFLSKQSVSYKDFFEQNAEKINKAYDCLASITSEYKVRYYKERNIEYNNMIKSRIEIDILEEAISTAERFGEKFPQIKK